MKTRTVRLSTPAAKNDTKRSETFAGRPKMSVSRNVVRSTSASRQRPIGRKLPRCRYWGTDAKLSQNNHSGLSR